MVSLIYRMREKENAKKQKNTKVKFEKTTTDLQKRENVEAQEIMHLTKNM